MSPRLARLGLIIALAVPAQAQTGVLTGTVVRDSTGQFVAGAEVSIATLDRRVTTNFRGEFKLDKLPAGLLTISIRRVGLTPLTDTIRLVEERASITNSS